MNKTETANQPEAPDVTTIDTSQWEPGVGPLPGPNDQPAVVELAMALPRVAALASYVNSEACTDQDRERLRELVSAGTYFMLLNNLADLRSTHARRLRRATRWSPRLTVDLVAFFDDYDESEET